MARTARGRWRADQTDTVEIYAERLEHAWTREIVVRYLEATYSQEAEALCDWIDRLLTENPDDVQAMLLRAHIDLHETRFAEAAALAQQVPGAAPANCQALEILSDA